MKSLGSLTGCALALACAHESKAVVGVSDTKTQGTVAGEASQPQEFALGNECLVHCGCSLLRILERRDLFCDLGTKLLEMLQQLVLCCHGKTQ